MKQTVVYDAIVAFIAERGYSPSIENLCVATGRTRGTIHAHLRRLRASGRITWEPNQPRTIRIIDVKGGEAS